MIRVFLVDDHEMIRRGVAESLNAEADITVVGEADSVAGALAAIDTAQPDVAILDISLGGGDGNGLDICRRVTERHRSVACLMLTSVIDDRAIVEAADAGAAGFCIKSIHTRDLLESIRTVASGVQLLDAVQVRRAQRRLEERGDGLIDTLTGQERRIFELIGRGYTNRQIANEMFLAEKTVKNYVSNMLAKLGMTRRTEAAALAARREERETTWRS